MFRFFIILITVTFLCNCSKSESNTEQSEEYYRGEAIYRQVCISCHNIDPRKVGPLAPEIAGSSYEIIESMIMTGKPPPGVEPKWPDREMAPLPNLKEKIPDIYEYLKTFK